MESLLFIYNADSGMANALLDSGRRVLTPKNYPCSLCRITYGPFGMKSDWKRFITALPYAVSFLHKDEVSASLRNELQDFPCLVLQQAGRTSILINGADFRNIKDLDTLKQKVTKTLANVPSHTNS